ncbi:MAG TPA: DUF1684 domain-containing protein [Thermoanaerobaculia bacterium]|nr:DUF1684 domain-containing protein [Thermoanaerobaculia bacterium]
MTRRAPSVAVLVAPALLATVLSCADPAPLALDLDAWEEWRSSRIAELTAEDGWLALVGLYWLPRDREVTFGAAGENDLVLPPRPSLEGRPGTLGTLAWNGDAIELRAAPGSGLEVDGSPAGDQPVPLRSDTAEPPSRLTVGALDLGILERAGELALRVGDRNSERRALLDHVPTFPPSADYRLGARFEPATPGRTLRIANVVGQSYDQASPGSVVFSLAGVEHRLEALATSQEDRYFLLVGDATNGVETYGGGRYLYVERRPDGGIDLDLNRLYNPPCVFTEFATCPLPPRANRLPVRIEAGEKTWHGDLDHG